MLRTNRGKVTATTSQMINYIQLLGPSKYHGFVRFCLKGDRKIKPDEYTMHP